MDDDKLINDIIDFIVNKFSEFGLLNISSPCHEFLIVDNNISKYSLSAEFKKQLDKRDYRKIYIKAIELGIVIHPKENGNPEMYTLTDLGREIKKKGSYGAYLNSLTQEENDRLLMRESILKTNTSLRITNKSIRGLNTTTKGYYKKQKTLTIISLIIAALTSIYIAMEYYKKDAAQDLSPIYKRLEKIENKLDSTQKSLKETRSFQAKEVIQDSLKLSKTSNTPTK